MGYTTPTSSVGHLGMVIEGELVENVRAIDDDHLGVVQLPRVLHQDEHILVERFRRRVPILRSSMTPGGLTTSGR